MYPGAVLSDSHQRGSGELYRLSDKDHVFRVLDPYEGYNPKEAHPTEFRRGRVPIFLNNGEVATAWVYLYPVPQKAVCVSTGMNVRNSPQGLCLKATGVSPWYGVYSQTIEGLKPNQTVVKFSLEFAFMDRINNDSPKDAKRQKLLTADLRRRTQKEIPLIILPQRRPSMDSGW